ncbi:13071_t:CDS:2, partial [Cetraspora pellucida]
MNWDIKYRNSKYTVEEILEKNRIINKENKGEEIVIKLFEYCENVKSQLQQIILVNSQIESSSSNKRKFVELSDEEELSDIQSNDSEYTYVVMEQAIIQSNYEELNINIEENKYLDFNMQESDIELDIKNEEIYEEFQRTNKKKSEFKCLK